MYGIIIRNVKTMEVKIEWIGESLEDVLKDVAELGSDPGNIYEHYQVIKSVGDEV